jgi:DNA replication and repair protein RecF
VHVESVSVLDFRNLAGFEVGLGPGINLLWGANGAGKTNLLEASYMALVGRSCRTRDDRETIAFGQGLSRVEATVLTDGHRATFLCSISRSDGRRHLLDGAATGPQSADQRPPVAVFMPDRLALVKGPPATRRSHLDGFWTALWPSRAGVRKRYSAALAQRNALLGRIRAGAASAATLDSWDAELAAAGIELIANRTEATARLAPAFEAAARSLGLAADAEIGYRPRSAATEPDQLIAELAERREGDIARGYTGWGPHHDELAIESAGRSLRRYGSQGQQRSALLALLFAERDVLVADGRPAPLMLLDDVTSELDADHRALLVEHLANGGGQAVVTATEPDHLPSSTPRTEIAIRAGRPLGEAGSEAA